MMTNQLCGILMCVYSIVNESSPATREEGKMYSYILIFILTVVL